MFYKTGILKSQTSINVTALVSLSLLIILCMFPEICFAADGASVEGQLTKVGDLADNKLKVISISLAAIIAGAIALMKGNFYMVATIGSCAVCLGLILEWIKGGMVFAI